MTRSEYRRQRRKLEQDHYSKHPRTNRNDDTWQTEMKRRKELRRKKKLKNP